MAVLQTAIRECGYQELDHRIVRTWLLVIIMYFLNLKKYIRGSRSKDDLQAAVTEHFER